MIASPTGLGQCITDGVGSHGNNEHCTFRANTFMYVMTTYFEVEYIWDFLEIGGVRYTGSFGPTNVLLEAGDSGRWFADQWISYGGFTLCGQTSLFDVPRAPPPSLPPSPIAPVPSGQAWTILSGAQFCEITDLGRCVTDGVGQHGNLESCRVRANHNLYATATYFVTEPYFDFIELGGYRYSGTGVGAGPQNAQMASGDTFRWYADFSITYGGWTICAYEEYQAQPSPPPPSVPLPTLSPFPPMPPVSALPSGSSIVRMPATIVEMALTLAGDASDFTEDARAGLVANLQAELDCATPECVLELRVAGASIALTVLMIIPEPDGIGQPTSRHAVLADVQFQASRLAALTPAELSVVFEVTVLSASAPITRTVDDIPVVVGPTPSLGLTAAERESRERMRRGLLVVGALGGFCLLGLCFCLVKRHMEKTGMSGWTPSGPISGAMQWRQGNAVPTFSTFHTPDMRSISRHYEDTSRTAEAPSFEVVAPRPSTTTASGAKVWSARLTTRRLPVQPRPRH